PSTPQVGLEEALAAPRRALWPRDAAPQAVAGIGGDRRNRLLRGIERERVEAHVLAPELLLERRPQRLRLGTQAGGTFPLSECLEDLRHAHPGVKHVALELAERLRLSDLASVGIDHRVARVLPAHVLVALRRARLVLLEPVAVEVSVAVDPIEAAERRLPVLAQQRVVAEPLPRLAQ